MLESLRDTVGCTVIAEEREVGEVIDAYFDDHDWNVRYLVVDGTWLPNKGLLLSPERVEKVDVENSEIRVSASLQEIESAPNVLDHLPVSLQKEVDLAQFEDWGPDYDEAAYPFAAAVQGETPDALGEAEYLEPAGRRRLRSAEALWSYRVRAADAAVGMLEDFLAELDGWIIRYLVVDAQRAMGRELVLVPPDWVERVDGRGARVLLSVDRDVIARSPELGSAAEVTRQYEQRLYDVYGHPPYWEQDT
jgi:hypothetical protein